MADGLRTLGVRAARVVAGLGALTLVGATAGCTVHQAGSATLTGPSEFGLSISVTATPDSITQDGKSQSAVLVVARDANGKAISGLPVRLDMELDGVLQDFGTLSARTIVTGSDGRASAIFTAPPPPPPSSGGGSVMTIRAIPTGSNFQTAAPQSADIRLVPPGVILPPVGSPTASFIFSPASPSLNISVLFDGGASLAGTNAAQISSYAWSFGDGGTASGRTASHAFGAIGTFNVTLTVTNERGLQSSVTKDVTVGAGTNPTADFVFSPTPVVVGAMEFFDASTSKVAPGRTLVGYTWNWGDGSDITNSGDPQAQHHFLVAGTYTIVLTVVDDIGQKGTKAASLTVGTGSPTASFTSVVVNPATHTIQVDASASTAVGNATITNYDWSWGDASPPTSGGTPIQSHSYAAAGTYSVRLTVTDSLGRSGSTTTSVTTP